MLRRSAARSTSPTMLSRTPPRIPADAQAPGSPPSASKLDACPGRGGRAQAGGRGAPGGGPGGGGGGGPPPRGPVGGKAPAGDGERGGPSVEDGGPGGETDGAGGSAPDSGGV